MIRRPFKGDTFHVFCLWLIFLCWYLAERQNPEAHWSLRTAVAALAAFAISLVLATLREDPIRLTPEMRETLQTILAIDAVNVVMFLLAALLWLLEERDMANVPRIFRILIFISFCFVTSLLSEDVRQFKRMLVE